MASGLVTEEQLQQARDLRTQGLSVRAIGRSLRLSHATVLKHLGPSPAIPVHPPELVLQVRQRAATGESMAEIARQLRIPHGTVCSWVWGRHRRECGGPMTRPRRTTCAGRCCHWGANGCTMGFPPDDWQPDECAAFSPRQPSGATS